MDNLQVAWTVQKWVEQMVVEKDRQSVGTMAMRLAEKLDYLVVARKVCYLVD